MPVRKPIDELTHSTAKGIFVHTLTCTFPILVQSVIFDQFLNKNKDEDEDEA